MSEVVEFDFRKPGGLPADTASVIAAWQGCALTCLEIRLMPQIPCAVVVSGRSPAPIVGSEIASRYKDDAICFGIDVGNNRAVSQLVVTSSVAKRLTAIMLGSESAQQPEEQEEDEESEGAEEAAEAIVLTDIESSLLAVVFAEFVAALGDDQPFSVPIPVQPQQVRTIKQIGRDFPSASSNIVVPFELQLPVGTFVLEWLLSQPAVGEIAECSQGGRAANAEDTAKLAEIVSCIPLEMVIRLGGAQVPLGELAKLRKGDVIVLDQPVAEPLPAKIGESTKFVGWPAKVGGRTAYQIASVESAS